MNRLFVRHHKRNVKSLDGIWQFVTDPTDNGVKDLWYKDFPTDCQDMLVPGCWNNELGLFDYEGAAWYQTEFVTATNQINLVFHGFYGQIDVYVDGTWIASQYGGFAGLACLVENLTPGKHTLIVRVDNTHNSQNTIPLARVDWFHYGGLFRGVEMMELNDVWISDYRIDYTLDESLQTATLDITANLQAFTSATTRSLAVYVNDQQIYTTSVVVDGTTKVEITDQKLANVKLWAPEHPNLYLVRLEFEDDDLIERIGFRKIAAANGKLYLNNQPLQLKGVNRHEDHPDWGFAMPLRLMKRDLDIIKQLGCNTVRGSHYPNAPIFLDLLDQEGILFWEEIPMWGFPEGPLQDPLTKERGLLMHETMVIRDFHHPSIIMWGMHNEIDTKTQAAYDITQAFSTKVRALDPKRPITYATMYPLEDICYDLVDIISVNKYFGWYIDSTEQWDKFLDELKVKLKNENLEQMPIIISEFGAGAMYGHNSFDNEKWSESYQSEYLEYTIDLFLNDPDICGMYIWQYCDIRSSKELEMARPRSFNNKGIVNEYRKPKQAYWQVKALFSQK